MASIHDLLLSCLEELLQEDFDRFKSSLSNNIPQDFDPIPRGKLENAKQLKVVDLMVDQYGDSAANITVQILKRTRQNNLASKLENKLEGLEGNVSGGSLKEDFSFKKTKTGSRPQAAEVDEYKMASKPRGFCLIINNMDFGDPEKYRHGSEKDEESLKEVFKWLGFSVEVRSNQTAKQMKETLNTYSQKEHKGDCFVCCILSHGETDGVCGTDYGIVTRQDIFSPFYGNNCKSLINKPKAFFIQACRGGQRHPVVQVDGHKEEKAGEEQNEREEPDDVQIILDGVDFFIAQSTIEGYFAIRNTRLGSWFIWSLCKQLKEYCLGGTDINLILTKTNEEVSRRVAAGQVSVYQSTLRKSLVFKPVQN